ncbi:DUF1217 domain-containing protein [Sulfitobacter aestuariivivens]|uniref:DUF1217 domain-containing protein n=1 Tax=Sulfitobacter aestuariivivens TaxID=2766981 RepID=A0A927HHQ7_9RHOB|nr:DUF1217 domain-containing protein [Sulfitobacter aestuariivivens]MBD3665500.1 DUF1217 domain-containing protein [Sulfitobacter aestuariivivens]
MFQPIVPDGGLVGWRFLQRTYDSQFETFTQSPVLQRDTDYFREKISSITTAEELVLDRRLLSVALGAFGLQDDIDNRYFIQKVLADGTNSDDALAMRLADTRYREMSESFGFGPAEFLKTGEPDFIEVIITRFQTSSFEVASGQQDDAMRVALYAQRKLAEIVTMDGSENTKWFTIMGDPPMRQLFEKALNLPSSVGQIDIDQQLVIFKNRATRLFGGIDLAQFADASAREDLIARYLLQDQIDNLSAGLSSNAIALTLLQS